jgi:hypothetical protein
LVHAAVGGSDLIGFAIQGFGTAAKKILVCDFRRKGSNGNKSEEAEQQIAQDEFIIERMCHLVFHLKIKALHMEAVFMHIREVRFYYLAVI